VSPVVRSQSELLVVLQDADRVHILKKRLEYELTQHRCADCFEPLEFDSSKVPAFLHYTCGHGPKDICCEKLVAKFKSQDAA